MTTRGYFGVGIFRPKNMINIGTLWRTAQILGVDFMFTIESRYKRQPSDVLNASKHVPLFHFSSFLEFTKNLPDNCAIVAVELTPDAKLLQDFKHPERAAYMLGAEDTGIPNDILRQCDQVVKLVGERSLNVSTAGSIVIHDRVTRG